MWLALTWIPPHEAGDVDVTGVVAADGLALVSAFAPDGQRLFRMRLTPAELPDKLRFVRSCGSGAPRGIPPCRCCGSTFGVPDFDAAADAELEAA
jgi:hypothetical protein